MGKVKNSRGSCGHSYHDHGLQSGFVLPSSFFPLLPPQNAVSSKIWGEFRENLVFLPLGLAEAPWTFTRIFKSVKGYLLKKSLRNYFLIVFLLLSDFRLNPLHLSLPQGKVVRIARLDKEISLHSQASRSHLEGL